jgi:cell division protease FtsH
MFSLLMLGGVTVFVIRGMARRDGGQITGGGHAEGVGQSGAKLLTESTRRVTFKDVAGIDEARLELEEIVAFLKEPAKFQKLGGKIPKGCLLVGPPGTGKTLMARAIAGEAGVPFFSVSGSAFVEMFVGVGASRVRDMFAQARKKVPCIVFIDEIDAVGRRRSSSTGSGANERDHTLNQLLVEMDGFEVNEGIIVIAATNRPDMLDAALLRSGRFDRQVAVPNPDAQGREKILEIHLQSVPLASDVDRMVIARGTPGFSGADLANLVNEAALLAARRGNSHVAMAELEDAKDKALMGSERRSLAMTQQEKETTAYHEAGHALVAFYTPGHDPLHKVTIVPRGRVLGLTMSLPDHDRYGFNKQELDAKIAMLLGGRVAEELVFGKEFVTTGASDDIRQASSLARRMVTEFGFGVRLGPLHYGMAEREFFLGHQVGARNIHSEATATLIDEESRGIVEAGEAWAREILTGRFAQLALVAKTLIERETLSGEQIRALLDVGIARNRSD